jgi:hypothetical protein
LTATVVGRDFLGDSLVVRLRLADGTIVLADRRGSISAAIGDSVQIGWPADAAHLFAAEEAAP